MLAIGVGAADAEDVRPAPPTEPTAQWRPFAVGEKLTYNAKVNFLHVGTGTMSVVGIDTIRGHTAFHTAFDVHGRMLFYSVNDHYERSAVNKRGREPSRLGSASAPSRCTRSG